MAVEFKDLVELIKAIAWPLVIAVTLIAFRKPLTRFIEELGKRTTKLSAFDFSIEFATVPSPPAPWSDPTMYESSNLIGGNVTSTTIMELFQRIRDEKSSPTWQYLIVDIETGKRWLISRLFLFTVILRYMLGLRCVVFVETRRAYRMRLLGIANPELVRVALAERYPWLDEALVKAWSDQQIPVLAETLPKDKAELIVNSFIMDSRIRRGDDPQDQDNWAQLGNQQVWEHTRWLNSERIIDDLQGVLYERDVSQVVDSPVTSVTKRNEAVLRHEAPFVALVSNRGEFKGLVDRQALLERVAAHISESA